MKIFCINQILWNFTGFYPLLLIQLCDKQEQEEENISDEVWLLLRSLFSSIHCLKSFHSPLGPRLNTDRVKDSLVRWESCSSVNYCNCNWLASDWKLTNRFVTSRSENIKILLIINLNWGLAGSVKDCAALKLFLLTFTQRRRYQVREKLVFYKIWETEFMGGETSQVMWLNNKCQRKLILIKCWAFEINKVFQSCIMFLC